MRRALTLVLLLLGLAACASAPDPPGTLARGCQRERRADLTLQTSRNFLLAPVRLNGHAALLVVDTGAEVTTITPEAAAALGLPRDPHRGSLFIGVSGPMRADNVNLRHFALGGVERRDLSLGLGAMPPFPGVSPPVAGLLGTDVLAGYEVELDLPERHMALYAPGSCGGTPPWVATAAVRLDRTRSGLAFVNAVVDGRSVRALVDTGARTTLLAREAAETLGITEAAIAQDPERRGFGIGLSAISIRSHRFGELGLPGAMAYNVSANIAELRLPGVEMLLGADYLGPRKTWISYATGRLFVR
jgi:predicted aspartyl protease